MPDNSVDAIITDPPYGIGLAEWDSVVDIPLFTAHVERIAREFYAFFGQMPTVLNWVNAATDSGMKYREHISWVKRNIGISHRLSRCHESIFIYGESATQPNRHRLDELRRQLAEKRKLISELKAENAYLREQLEKMDDAQ